MQLQATASFDRPGSQDRRPRSAGSRDRRAGDPPRDGTAAFEWLYGQYRQRAYGLAYLMLRDPQAAEDVVQEAYVAVWRRAASVGAVEGSFRSWVLTIVRNRAIDHIRGRSYRQTAFGLDTAMSAIAPDNPEQTALVNDDRARIRHALEHLNARQRRTLELAYFGGLSQTEIAQHMGVPLGTVKGRMRSGLTRMRGLLQLADAKRSPVSTRPTVGR